MVRGAEQLLLLPFARVGVHHRRNSRLISCACSMAKSARASSRPVAWRATCTYSAWRLGRPAIGPAAWVPYAASRAGRAARCGLLGSSRAASSCSGERPSGSRGSRVRRRRTRVISSSPTCRRARGRRLEVEAELAERPQHRRAAIALDREGGGRLHAEPALDVCAVVLDGGPRLVHPVPRLA